MPVWQFSESRHDRSRLDFFFFYRRGSWKCGGWVRLLGIKWFRHTSLLQSPKQRMRCPHQPHHTTVATSPRPWRRRNAHRKAARTLWTLWALAAAAPVALAVVAAGAAVWWALCCSPMMWRFGVGRTRALGLSSCPPWAGPRRAQPSVSARKGPGWSPSLGCLLPDSGSELSTQQKCLNAFLLHILKS